MPIWILKFHSFIFLPGCKIRTSSSRQTSSVRQSQRYLLVVGWFFEARSRNKQRLAGFRTRHTGQRLSELHDYTWHDLQLWRQNPRGLFCWRWNALSGDNLLKWRARGFLQYSWYISLYLLILRHGFQKKKKNLQVMQIKILEYFFFNHTVQRKNSYNI